MAESHKRANYAFVRNEGLGFIPFMLRALLRLSNGKRVGFLIYVMKHYLFPFVNSLVFQRSDLVTTNPFVVCLKNLQLLADSYLLRKGVVFVDVFVGHK